MLRNKTAANIAGYWHGGQWSALYQFASSKTYIIENHLRYLQEVEAALHPEYNLKPSWLLKEDERHLNSLKQFFIAQGEANGIKTTFEKHKQYGYLVPYITEDTAKEIVSQINAIKYLI